MPADFIPPKDQDLAVWAATFAAAITATPTDYGLVAGQASAFTTLQLAFQAALDITNDPATRTTPAIATKDGAKAAMVASARQLARIIQSYPSITDELLTNAGLPIHDPVPGPIPAPTTVPVLSMLTSGSLQHTLRYKDSVLVNPRSKPPGVTAIQLYRKIGSTPPAAIADCVFVGQYSRMPMVVDFAGSAAGETAYYLARYVTAKGLLGPQSDLFSATVPA